MEQNGHKGILSAWAVLFPVLMIALAVGLGRSRSPQLRAKLSDGRIVQVEGVTFGRDHAIGWPPSLSEMSATLAARLRQVPPSSLRPVSRMHFEQPMLMVWLNALDPNTGKYVEPDQLEVGMLDEHGVVYPGHCWSASGTEDFWRNGFAFDVFPRNQSKLTLQVTPYGSNRTARIQIRNPHVVRPAVWSGKRLPQAKTVGSMEVAITGLVLKTNVTHFDWETPFAYWQPVWDLRQSRQTAVGWDAPEWVAEDPKGNRSRFLAVHEPILHFEAKFWPSATNTQEAVLIGTSPCVALDSLHSIVWWNLEIPYQTNKMAVVGLFPPGKYSFSQGQLTDMSLGRDPFPDDRFLGWRGSTTQVRPGKRLSSWAHRTQFPTIYLHAPGFGPEERLAVRIRDAEGHYWPTKVEFLGPLAGTNSPMAYVLQVPAEVRNVVAEFVVLKPVQADFFVSTASGLKP